MKHELKKRLLEYITSHNDRSDKAEILIKDLEKEMETAETDCHSVCCCDLDHLDEKTKNKLRKKLNKKENEEFTFQDCIRVADAIEEMIYEDFGEDIRNAIKYKL